MVVDVTKVLSKVGMFKGIPFAEMSKLRDRMRTVSFKEGERAIKEGDAGDRMFIITKGVAVVTKNAPVTDWSIPGAQVRFESTP